MDIHLSEIIDTIKKFGPELYIFKKDYAFIHAVELFNRNQKLFQLDFLYVGKASDLSEIPFERLPMNMLCIADVPFSTEYIHHLDSNIIIINKDVDTIEILNEINYFLRINQYYVKSSLKLMDSLLNGRSLQHILNTCHDVLGNPLFINDTSFKVLCYTQRINVNDSWWNENTRVNYLTNEAMMLLKESGKLDQLSESNLPIIFNLEFSQHRWLAHKVMINGKILGHLCVIEYEKQFKKSDIKLVQLICDVLSCAMQKIPLFYYNKGNDYEYFITDLLEGKEQSPESIKERLKYINLDFGENLYVITVSHISKSDEYKPDSYTINILDSLVSGSKSIIYRNNFVMVFSYKNKTLDKDYLKKFSEFLEKQKLVGGLSRHFQDIANIREYYLQSVKSIDLGIRLDGKKSIYVYDDYSIYHLIDIASEHKDLKSFCNPQLITLIDYDRKNNTSYTESLYVYLSNGNSIVASSRVLNIHRNTMDYRISKIEEIMNLKLSDPNVALSLYLSCKILKFIETSN